MRITWTTMTMYLITSENAGSLVITSWNIRCHAACRFFVNYSMRIASIRSIQLRVFFGENHFWILRWRTYRSHCSTMISIEGNVKFFCDDIHTQNQAYLWWNYDQDSGPNGFPSLAGKPLGTGIFWMHVAKGSSQCAYVVWDSMRLKSLGMSDF